MADNDGWVNPRLTLTPFSPYRRPYAARSPRRPIVTPRCPPTAIVSASGGLTGGEANGHPSTPLLVPVPVPKWRYGNLRRPPHSSSVPFLSQPPPLSSSVPLHRHPSPSTDPYRVRGGLQPFELEAEFDSDDEYPGGLGVAGGMEEARCETGEEVMSPMDFSPVYFPWKPSTEEWAECVAIAEKQCKDEGFLSLDEVMLF